MKKYIISADIPQNLDYFIIYCEDSKDPIDLLYSEEYEDVLISLYDDLYSSYGYLYEDEISDLDDEEILIEQYNNFIDMISFSINEIIDESDEEFDENEYEVIIDERKNI